MIENKAKVGVRGTPAAATYRSSVLVVSFEVTLKEAKQIKAGAILYLAPERARALCDDGICEMVIEKKSVDGKEINNG